MGAIPPGKLVAPAASYLSGGGGNKTVGAFETEGPLGGSASRQVGETIRSYILFQAMGDQWQQLPVFFGDGGTSLAGLAVKKPLGLSVKPM